MKSIFATIAALVGAVTSLHAAAVVSVSAGQYNGLAGVNGVELAQGDLVRVGFFNLTDAQIQQNNVLGAGISFLDSNFVQFGTAAIGDNFGLDGYFSKSITNSTITLGLANKQIYLWVLNATTLGAATQDSIFYMTGTSEWIFKDDNSNPNTANPDIADLTGASNALLPGAHLVLGTFPGASSTVVAGAKNFNLVAITPEPSSIMLLGMGAVGLLARRRRNS